MIDKNPRKSYMYKEFIHHILAIFFYLLLLLGKIKFFTLLHSIQSGPSNFCSKLKKIPPYTMHHPHYIYRLTVLTSLSK